MTIENRIIQPKIARFALNIQAKIWSDYDEGEVYASALDKISNYMLSISRNDIIPISDIISVLENDVAGIDSVRAWFDADTNNVSIYGDGNYGLDEYGDIIMTRTITDANGQYQTVRDVLPLIRGGFTSKDGVEYSNI